MPDAGETTKAVAKPNIASTKTKAETIIEQMTLKLQAQEKDHRSKHTFLKTRRASSAPKLTSPSTKRLLFDLKEQNEDGVFVFEHPLHSYQRYVQKYVKHNFDQIKIKYGYDEKELRKAMREIRPRCHLRVRSQQPSSRAHQMRKAFRPKTMKQILKEEELQFNIRLCDMGNACYIDKHYSDLIQTREYRGPEVLLNGEYDESADLWSLACMVFELVTGDYLFDPKKGKTFKKNDDHLALITELIGEMDP